MATDITLETEAVSSVATFEDYLQAPFLQVWSAIVMAIDDPEIDEQALDQALTQVRLRWHRDKIYESPDLFVLAAAIAPESGADRVPREARACVGAHELLGASADEIAAAFVLDIDLVTDYLTQGPIDLTHQLEPPAALPPRAANIVQRHRTQRRRRQLRLAGTAAAIVLSLGLLAQLVARPGRVATEQVAEPAPVEDPTTAAQPAAGEIGNEPRPDLVPRPELITTDGDGGFVGVRSPSPQNRQVIFTRSSDGDGWELASRWGLGPDTTISRFERAGEYYMAWIEGATQSSETVVATVGISRDLIAWTVVELAVDDPDPLGLTFTSEVVDLSVSGNNILALVTTTVEIDFGDLLLDESYTCGQTITETEVSLNLCNTDLDVLSLSDIETLPERNRLFLSRDGNSFEQIDVPFDGRTASHLTSVNGAFAVTDETGMRFAQSANATDWQIITAGKPPFPVRAAATNQASAVVGVGSTTGGELVLFHHDGQATNITTTPLESITGPLDPDVHAIVGSSTSRWAVYVFEPQMRDWLLTSTNGRRWKLAAAGAPQGTEPRVLVGDDEVLVQWIDADAQIDTLAVQLDS